MRRLLALLLLAGCGNEVAGDAVSGAEIYARACATCHGADGKPPAAMVAQLGVTDLTGDGFRSRVTAPLVARQVRHGSENKLMPAFAGALSEAQIKAVAEWIAAGMPPEPEAGGSDVPRPANR